MLIKKVILICAFYVFSTLGVFAAGGEWGVNLEAAMKEAKEGDKTVLLVLSGRQWCGPCRYLDSKVLQSATFMEFAKNNLLLVVIDKDANDNFTAKEDQQQQAKAWEKYGREYVPAVFVINPKTEEANEIKGAAGMPPEAFVALIRKFKKDWNAKNS